MSKSAVVRDGGTTPPAPRLESLPKPPQPKTKAGLDYDALRHQFADEMLALLTLSDEQAAANEG